MAAVAHFNLSSAGCWEAEGQADGADSQGEAGEEQEVQAHREGGHQEEQQVHRGQAQGHKGMGRKWPKYD